jgi:hypothetical protein
MNGFNVVDAAQMGMGPPSYTYLTEMYSFTKQHEFELAKDLPLGFTSTQAIEDHVIANYKTPFGT